MTNLISQPLSFVILFLLGIGAMPLSRPTFAQGQETKKAPRGAIDIGSRRELFVDRALIERMSGEVSLKLHHPSPREVSLVTGEAWEGNGTNYVTVFQDDDLYRMYYRGCDVIYTKEGYREPHREFYCYAESKDGMRWTKPKLGLFEFNGSKENNIVVDGVGVHNFTPFKDANPSCKPEARYKALGSGGGGKHGLYAFQSADGLHWKLMHPEPVITVGAFDSQNLAFWDTERGEYREYHRDFREGRDIRTTTSKDFLTWKEPAFVSYQPSRVSELYTNQILPYYRAPHLFLGFPTRYTDRGWTDAAEKLPRPEYRRLRGAKSPREGTAVTDGMFITSRDATSFNVWPESFIRPGLRLRDNWFYGDTYQNWGLVETRSEIEDAPPEISIYVTERTLQDKPAILRRHTLRVDGFVSLNASLSSGELLTHPLVFRGRKLSLNGSTSGIGSIRVEVQDLEGKPLPGFSLAECAEFYGDSLDYTLSWKGSDLSKRAGTPVRLRFVLKDADLYSFQFRE